MSNIDEGSGIILDSGNNVYAVGRSEGTWGLPGKTPINDYTGGRDIFVLKLNSSGTYQWHTFFGATDDDESFIIDSDTNDNVLVGGYSMQSWVGPRQPSTDSSAFRAAGKSLC